MHTPLLTISRRLRCTRCGERKAHARPEPRTSAITARWHPSQLSQRCLPSFSTIARFACFQASSVGLRCQGMPACDAAARVGREATRGSDEGGQGRGYIWAMDEKDISGRRARPAGKDRALEGSHAQLRMARFSSCGLTVEDIIPIPVPAPCPKCSGIAFEAIEPSDD